MICPVEIAREMSALRAVRIGDHAEHGSLSEGRDGAGDESTGRDVAGDGQEDHMVAGGGDSRHQRPAHAADSGALRLGETGAAGSGPGGARPPAWSAWQAARAAAVAGDAVAYRRQPPPVASGRTL